MHESELAGIAIGQALRRSSTRLDHLVRREREFTVNASHELLSPITALNLQLEDHVALAEQLHHLFVVRRADAVADPVRWEVLANDPRGPLSNVKYFSSTFDAIHPRTISRLLKSSERRSPLFFQIYGQSECPVTLTILPADEAIPAPEVPLRCGGAMPSDC